MRLRHPFYQQRLVQVPVEVDSRQSPLVFLVQGFAVGDQPLNLLGEFIVLPWNFDNVFSGVFVFSYVEPEVVVGVVQLAISQMLRFPTRLPLPVKGVGISSQDVGDSFLQPLPVVVALGVDYGLLRLQQVRLFFGFQDGP